MVNWLRIAGNRKLRYSQVTWPVVTLLILILSAPESHPQEPVQSITVNVRLVNLNVAVTDKNGQPYSGLSADNFRVYDNGVEQAIHHFSHDDLPYSMGLVLDRSGSMSGMIQEVYNAAFHTVRASKAEDEFFIELFNDRVEIRQELTSDQGLLRRQLEGVVAYGSTALYDAILAGLDHLKKGRHDKKALLVVTDGADNSSKHSVQQVLERARAEGVMIYVVGMFDEVMLAAELTREDQLRVLLSQIAEVTGGRAYFPKSVKQCEQACIAIARDLREQYSLGYYARPKLMDGSWRTVQVQLSLPEELYKNGLTARTRSGYFAPKQ
jgi:Ca-activated chloride channel family protein